MKNRIVHFEIHAQDAERAAKFYKEVFDWKIDKWPGMEYWMVMTDEQGSKEPGISGGLLIRKGPAPVDGQAVNAFVCTAQVDDIDATIEKIIKAGGTEALPKYMIGDMAWQAYYKDLDGNIFGVHQRIEKDNK